MRQRAGFVPVVVVLVAACASAAPAARRAGAEDLQTGVGLYREGKYAEAEGVLRSVSGAEAKAYLSGSLARQGKADAALAPAEEALKENPTHEVAVYALGRALVEKKQWDAVVARMSAVIEKNPRVPYAYYWRAYGYQNTGKGARMLDDFQTFLGLAPEAPEAQTVKQLLASYR